MAGVLWVGLDYTAVCAVLEARGVAVTPEIWDALLMIELGAKNELNREKR